MVTSRPLDPSAWRERIAPLASRFFASSTAPLAWAVSCCAVVLSAACGGPEPGVGGAGRFDAERRVLDLAGTPRQMGLWQGTLLRSEIRALLPAWRARLLEAVLGRAEPKGEAPAGGGGSAAALAEDLARSLELLVDQCAANLSERHRQELDGLAEAVGVPPLELLELEVARDVLRMNGLGPRLDGAMGIHIAADGAVEARLWWTGADAELLRGKAIWVRRRSTLDEPSEEVALLAWPGALGGLAGIHAGRGVFALEAEPEREAQRGFGRGLPFSLALRAALESTGSVLDLAGGLQGTTGHVVATVGAPARAPAGGPASVLDRVSAFASFEAYVRADERPRHMDEAGFLAVVGEFDLAGVRSAALDAAAAALLREGRDPWPAVAAAAPTRDDEPAMLRVRWDAAGEASVERGGTALPGR